MTNSIWWEVFCCFAFSVSHNSHKEVHETHGHGGVAGHGDGRKEERAFERKGTVCFPHFQSCEKKQKQKKDASSHHHQYLWFYQFTTIQRDTSVQRMATKSQQAHLSMGREGRSTSIKVYRPLAPWSCSWQSRAKEIRRKDQQLIHSEHDKSGVFVLF